jgi:dephospho-CoA kinase
MIVIGLTGSIGMGKSTTAKMLRSAHIPVFDADAYVHRALRSGGRALRAVAAAFPESYDAAYDQIDRQKLGSSVFHQSDARKKLEAILHPIVRQAEIKFIRRHRIWHTKIIVLDIPLLFETGADQLCDAVICVTAPDFIQLQRILRRPGMTIEKAEAIRAAQMDNHSKRLRADYTLETGQGRAATWRDLQTILRHVKQFYARNRP